MDGRTAFELRLELLRYSTYVRTSHAREGIEGVGQQTIVLIGWGSMDQLGVRRITHLIANTSLWPAHNTRLKRAHGIQERHV